MKAVHLHEVIFSARFALTTGHEIVSSSRLMGPDGVVALDLPTDRVAAIAARVAGAPR